MHILYQAAASKVCAFTQTHGYRDPNVPFAELLRILCDGAHKELQGLPCGLQVILGHVCFAHDFSGGPVCKLDEPLLHGLLADLDKQKLQ